MRQGVIILVAGVLIAGGYWYFTQGSQQQIAETEISKAKVQVTDLQTVSRKKMECKALFNKLHRQLTDIDRVIRNNIELKRPAVARTNAQKILSSFSSWNVRDNALHKCRMDFVEVSDGYLENSTQSVDIDVVVQKIRTMLRVEPKRLPVYDDGQLEQLRFTLGKIASGKINQSYLNLYNSQSTPVYTYFKQRLVMEENLEKAMDNAFEIMKSIGSKKE